MQLSYTEVILLNAVGMRHKTVCFSSSLTQVISCSCQVWLAASYRKLLPDAWCIFTYWNV